MKKKRRSFPNLLNKEIISAAAEGKCLTRENDLVVFVPFAAVGDFVDIKINKQKKNFAEGEILAIHKLSEHRTEPVCKHFKTCGGCKWQHVNYNHQLEFKQKQVKDDFERIAKIDVEEYLPILGAENIFNYRNKIELTFSNKAWEKDFDKENPKKLPALGFHLPGWFDKILDIEECHLANTKAIEIVKLVKKVVVDDSLDFFDLRNQTGFLRNLMIRNNSANEFMVILIVNKNEENILKKIFEKLIPELSQVKEWAYVINNKMNDSWSDLEVITYKGKGFLTEKIEDKTYKIRPQSFFQTNYNQAIELYKITREFANLNADDIVYDLYTGTGSIALFHQHLCKKIIGIEYVEAAIEDAKENAILNNVNNAFFYAGDMKKVLTKEFIEKNGKPNVIITDPPRDGMHPDVVSLILEIEPEKIVYVSCNSATQARDLSLLKEKYCVKKSKAVDMFPHTHHIENVILLNLKK